jgi:hypothetical protein
MHVAICHSYIQPTLPRFISRSGFYNASDDNSVSDAVVRMGSYFMDVCAKVILFRIQQEIYDFCRSTCKQT